MTIAILMGVLSLAALLTGLVRLLALRRGMLDVPNERSSHAVPTPRGGGLAIVCACLLGWLALALAGQMTESLLLALAGGIAVAVVGLFDDFRSVRPLVRLAIHFAAAIWAVRSLGGAPPLHLGQFVCDLGWAGDLLGVLAIVWTLNLFNFMDGIDGIAAGEAAFVAIGGAIIAFLVVASSLVAPAALVLAAAGLGFLGWNWPPARIFMGDVGSGFLGFSLGVFAIACAHEAPVALWCWLILGALFFVDATVTLLRRLVRRERVYVAHRSHAYQQLAARYGHLRVTLTCMLVNVLVLLPVAVLSGTSPGLAPLLAGTVLIVTTFAAIRFGAGR